MSKGLYIHIPFCKSKCFYCNFGTIECRDSDCTELFSQYLDALRREIRYYSLAKIKSIYIGGGTPTIFKGEQISELLDFCLDNFEYDSNIEISIESNPGTLDRRKLKLLKKAGVNRLSIGIQSFNDRLLRKIGRIHTAKESVKSFYLARESGFDNINIDLIFALPSQRQEDWEITLKRTMRLAPEHICIYNLTIEEGTKLYDQLQKKEIEKAPNELEAQMYEWAILLLVSNGWKHYEISNFAYPGRECVHNNIYWRNEEYIGIGAGATSYLNGTRYTNINDPKIYIKKVFETSVYNEKNKESTGGLDASKLQQECEVLQGKKKIGETVILGLRMIHGIDITQDIEKYFSRVIEVLIKKKLLKQNGSNLRLTHQGLMFANQVYQEFLET